MRGEEVFLSIRGRAVRPRAFHAGGTPRRMASGDRLGAPRLVYRAPWRPSSVYPCRVLSLCLPFPPPAISYCVLRFLSSPSSYSRMQRPPGPRWRGTREGHLHCRQMQGKDARVTADASRRKA